MYSAFGVDHGEVEKALNPLAMLRGAGGARRAAGPVALPKPVESLRTFTGGAGAKLGGGLQRAGTKVTGAPGKRAGNSPQTRLGAGISRLGQAASANPVRAGAIGLGSAGAVGVGGAGAAGAAFGGRKKRPGQV